MNTELDNRMVINGGSNGPDWTKPDATPEEIAAEEAEEKRLAIEHEHAGWKRSLESAKSGDVVVRQDNDGFRHVLMVRENRMDLAGAPHLRGDGFLARDDGSVFGISLVTATVGPDQFDSIAALEVVCLG